MEIEEYKTNKRRARRERFFSRVFPWSILTLLLIGVVALIVMFLCGGCSGNWIEKGY